MTNKTKIEWCDFTWNPITGCGPISEGCQNCYAAGIAKRFWGDRKFSDIQFHHDRVDNPKFPTKPSKIFVCSMSDLFHEKVLDVWLNQVLLEIIGHPKHTFMILTKRPEIMRDKIRGEVSNMWLGVTVENQEQADKRIPILLQIPAAKRFVSVEPMLGAVDLNKDYMNGTFWGDKLHWVICGGETGRNKREMDWRWSRSLRDQCKAVGIPFFFKQDGNGNKKLDGKLHREFPI